MTEQEKREKAIEKMTKSVVACENNCKDCNFWCVSHFNAVRFYDAGYRKEEEVRKETLIEAAKWLDEEWGIGSLLLKEFGVEVEE